MRLLLDTHIAIWAALDPNSLLGSERKAIEAADPPIVLSAVALWEIRLKWHRFYITGERKGPIDPEAMVAFATRFDWGFLPLTVHHAAAKLLHPLDHKDPFDTLLLVQAQEERMRLLTRDAKLAGHPFAVTGTAG